MVHVQPRLLITVSLEPGSCLEWSPRQPWQHEVAHYSAITWRAMDTTEREWGRRKVLSVGGKMRVGWNDPNRSAKFCPPRDSRIGNSTTLCSVEDPQFLAYHKHRPQHLRGKDSVTVWGNRKAECATFVLWFDIFPHGFKEAVTAEFQGKKTESRIISVNTAWPHSVGGRRFREIVGNGWQNKFS